MSDLESSFKRSISQIDKLDLDTKIEINMMHLCKADLYLLINRIKSFIFKFSVDVSLNAIKNYKMTIDKEKKEFHDFTKLRNDEI